ncbi:MAG TPA: hypothetical protein VFF14_11720 [Candidatus Deferrimicrobium sp.]|nr:hypothetical protein [Candidatus Deferrimicrobium sp.]
MSQINWKQKLTSRKFWAAVIGFVTALLVAFNVDKITTQQVISVISACSVLIAYIIGEGIVDSSRTNNGGE